jgi:DNA-binding LytR/AlgR family response regulator
MLIAVCDDEKIIREKLTDALYGFFGRLDLTCKEYADGEELLSDIKKGVRPEALFLDIEMPVLDGMSTAVKLRELDIDIPVIFLTSHTEMAMDGYEVSAFRFLGKPVDEDKLNKTLSDLKEKLVGGKHIVIRYDGEDIVVPVDDIVYIEAQNNSIRIVLSKREYTIRGKLADIKNSFP